MIGYVEAYNIRREYAMSEVNMQSLKLDMTFVLHNFSDNVNFTLAQFPIENGLILLTDDLHICR